MKFIQEEGTLEIVIYLLCLTVFSIMASPCLCKSKGSKDNGSMDGVILSYRSTRFYDHYSLRNIHVKEFKSKKVVNKTELRVKVDLYQKFLKKG